MPSLIGTGPNQIPTNNLLGSLAFQDAENVKVGNANAVNISTTDLTSSGNTNLTNVSYSGTMTGGTGVINIGSNQIYKDATGNVGIGNSPVSNGKTLTLVNTSTGSSSFYLQNSTTGFTTTDGTLLQLSGSAAYLWNFENSTLSLGTNNTEFIRLTNTGDVVNLGTGATKVQEGTVAQRPSTPQEGMIRKNSTLGVIEGYSGGGYVSLEAGRLINVRLFTTHSTHSSFTIDPKTRTMVVELIGGGGGGGTKTSGAYSTNLHGSIGQCGGTGCAVKFLIKDPAQATFYYYIGAGGAPGAGSGVSGSNGTSSTFSLSPTSGTLVDYITAGFGNGGGVIAPTALPISTQGAGSNFYTKGGSLSLDATILEASGRDGIALSLFAATSSGALAAGSLYYGLNTPLPVGWASAGSDLISPTVYSFGAGGEGSYGYRNDTLGSFYSMSAGAGFQGMLRVYEYS